MGALIVLLMLSTVSSAETGGQGPALTAPDAASATIKDVEHEEKSLLQRHHPFYVAYGHALTKLQVSFKTPLVHEWPLYFGYTQFMFWATHEKSSPFRDLNYNPELFYRYSFGSGVFRSVDFGIWEHNSNGKDGADSRSFDSNYLRLNLEKTGRRWTVRFSTQASYLHGFDKTNQDIQDYIGPLSLSISFIQLFDAWFDKSEISLQASPGGKFAHLWDRGGYQLSWSFRLGKISLVPAFYLQYYRGYAENLLNYNVNVDQFRGGVIF